VEVRKTSELLPAFIHPADAIYVFGPEDGKIGKGILHCCHRFLVIPTRHCLNLRDAVATILYDRLMKEWQDGKVQLPTPGEFEQRGPYETQEGY
jgi:tRNA(Leu) C34 or U34 (ribose-2'-O)-methylase TrmL